MFKKFFQPKTIAIKVDSKGENKANEPILPRLSKFASFFKKVKFAIYLIICLVLLSSVMFFGNSYIVNITKQSINNDQSVMVNVITDEIFIGSLYKSPAENNEQSNTANEDSSSKDVKNNNSSEQDSPINYRATPLSEQDFKKAKISIVITGLGLSDKQTSEILTLDTDITLGFSPYAADLNSWIDKAVDKGFETLLQLPMQPEDYQINDPGPFALLKSASSQENLSKFTKLSELSHKNVGFYSSIDEVMTLSKIDITPILTNLSKSNYILLYSKEQNYPQMTEWCQAISLECLFINTSLEEEVNEAKIYKTLTKVNKDAITNGQAVIYINSYPSTIKILKKWMDELNSNQVIIVPLSNQLPPSKKIIDKK